jgi:hypothetical protein
VTARGRVMGMLALGAPLLVAACGDREGIASKALGPSHPGGASGASGGTGSLCPKVPEDHDGDGVVHYYVEAGCMGGTLEINNDQDCDDDDPAVQVRRYRDEDGDGDGAGTAECVPSGDLAGYSDSGADCDDADPARSSITIEVPGDGIDQDCTGGDLEPCSDTNTYCPCSVDPRCALEPGEPCDGIDLAVGAVVGCFDGSEAFNDYFFIANQGSRDFSGKLVLTQGTWSDVFTATIAAGEATAGRRLTLGGDPNVPLTVSTPDAVDCNPDNDAYPAADAVATCP